MKIAFVILTALTLVSTCNAALVDKFKCTIELSDFVTKNSSKVDKEFFIARLPFYSNQPQNVKFTMGQSSEQLTLNTANGVLSTNLNFYYKFAVMNENNAASSEARQLTCLGLSGDYCEKSGTQAPLQVYKYAVKALFHARNLKIHLIKSMVGHRLTFQDLYQCLTNKH